MYVAVGSWFWFLLVVLLLAVVWVWTRWSDTRANAQPAELVIDPVCGMEFPAGKAVAKVRHAGRTHYFCAEACRRQFERDPARYRGAAQDPASTS